MIIKIKILGTVLFTVISICSFAQAWTPEQIAKANTAKDVNTLSQSEKDVIKYINLARLYPKQFSKLEVENYLGSDKYPDYLAKSNYKKSLIITLNSMKAVPALNFGQSLYECAKCFAKESGNAGTTGHTRKKCPVCYAGECCSYGESSGLDIVMQWLIDDNVVGFGHRKACLNPAYKQIGVSIHAHKKWGACCVADFSG